MFTHIPKQREESEKYDAQRSIFDEIRNVWKYVQTLSWVSSIETITKPATSFPGTLIPGNEVPKPEEDTGKQDGKKLWSFRLHIQNNARVTKNAKKSWIGIGLCVYHFTEGRSELIRPRPKMWSLHAAVRTRAIVSVVYSIVFSANPVKPYERCVAPRKLGISCNIFKNQYSVQREGFFFAFWFLPPFDHPSDSVSPWTNAIPSHDQFKANRNQKKFSGEL